MQERIDKVTKVVALIAQREKRIDQNSPPSRLTLLFVMHISHKHKHKQKQKQKQKPL